MGDFAMELGRRSATDHLAAMRHGELTAIELLADAKERVERINPSINAIVSTDFAAAEIAAVESDRRRAAGEPLRPLEGLPVAVKDLEDTAGLRTTYGSLRHTDHVPDVDSLTVSRMRAAGAVIYGKTNTPEFGTGSHTYNRVFGTTTNPYAADRSAGGSSGGAAAALAAGLVAVADGSDMGGSLRNPASFCNVVGLRPSIGIVPSWPTDDAWSTLATAGPMGRTVRDVALLLSVLSGGDRRAPLSFPEPVAAAIAAVPSLRIGWSRTLGGLEIVPEITEVLDGVGLPLLQELGHSIIEVEPDLAEADPAFRTLRAIGYARKFGDVLKHERDLLGPELISNTEAGLRTTIDDLQAAVAQRNRVYGGLMGLFEGIDVLAGPTTTVLPFPADRTWPREVNGVAQADYLDWMRASWRISVTGFAAMSVPCGFSPEGLPVGLQLIAPPRHDGLLLALAEQFERARPVWRETPAVCQPANDQGPRGRGAAAELDPRRRQSDEQPHPRQCDAVDPRPHQGVHDPGGHELHSPRGHRSGDPARRVLRHARSLGLREDDAAALDRRPRAALERRDLARRSADRPVGRTGAASTPSSRPTRCSRISPSGRTCPSASRWRAGSRDRPRSSHGSTRCSNWSASARWKSQAVAAVGWPAAARRPRAGAREEAGRAAPG